MVNTALVTIANGPLYREYAKRMLASARKYFPEFMPFVWTDAHDDFERAHVYPSSPDRRGYPNSTLYRYHEFLRARQLLAEFDQIFYLDADMEWVAPAGDIFSDGITATRHPGFFVNNQSGSPEHREQSQAYLSGNRFYYCGGFNGGNTHAYLDMAQTIVNAIDYDLRQGIVAVWHDESHMNRYLHHNPPAKVLSPSYCFPEGYNGGYGWSATEHPAILVALEKNGKRQ